MSDNDWNSEIDRKFREEEAVRMVATEAARRAVEKIHDEDFCEMGSVGLFPVTPMSDLVVCIVASGARAKRLRDLADSIRKGK